MGHISGTINFISTEYCSWLLCVSELLSTNRKGNNMNSRILYNNDCTDNVIYVCQDRDLNIHLAMFFKFIELSAVEMMADILIDSIPKLQNNEMSMIVFEGKENIKKILNKNYLLRRDHPNMKFIMLLDGPLEEVNTEEHFEYVKYMYKEEVIQKISSLLGYVHSSMKYTGIPITTKYENVKKVSHKINAYV